MQCEIKIAETLDWFRDGFVPGTIGDRYECAAPISEYGEWLLLFRATSKHKKENQRANLSTIPQIGLPDFEKAR